MNREEIIAKFKEFADNPAMRKLVFARTSGTMEYYSLTIVLSGEVEDLANAILYTQRDSKGILPNELKSISYIRVEAYDIDCIAITIPSSEPFCEQEEQDIINEYKSLPGLTFEERWYECTFGDDIDLPTPN